MREGNTGMTRVIEDPEGDVPIVAIDDLALLGVSVIKIDTEGFELEVLKGARQTIERERPLLYIEAGDSERHEAVRAFMDELGFVEFGCFAKTPTYGYRYAPRQDIKVSIAIMAHPQRAPFVQELLERLDVTPEVVWDRENNSWETGRRSLLAFARALYT